jgi:DNA-directed RNA polymerase specialized sigma24 family protein
MKAVVYEAIGHLEEPKRSVVRMRLPERRSVKEVSFLLDLSESNVKVTLFRAPTEVKTSIAGKVGEPNDVWRDRTETSRPAGQGR